MESIRFAQIAPLVVVMLLAPGCKKKDAVGDNGFAVTGTWGGYEGEAHGEGPELVVAFTHA